MRLRIYSLFCVSPNFIANVSSELPFVRITPCINFTALSESMSVAMLLSFRARHLRYLDSAALKEWYFCRGLNIFRVFEILTQSKLLESITTPSEQISTHRNDTNIILSTVNIFNFYSSEGFDRLCMWHLVLSLKFFEIFLVP